MHFQLFFYSILFINLFVPNYCTLYRIKKNKITIFFQLYSLLSFICPNVFPMETSDDFVQYFSDISSSGMSNFIWNVYKYNIIWIKNY